MKSKGRESSQFANGNMISKHGGRIRKCKIRVCAVAGFVSWVAEKDEGSCQCCKRSWRDFSLRNVDPTSGVSKEQFQGSGRWLTSAESVKEGIRDQSGLTSQQGVKRLKNSVHGVGSFLRTDGRGAVMKCKIEQN